MKPRSWKLFLTFFISYTSHGALPAKKISNESTRAYKSNELHFISKKNQKVFLNCQKYFWLLLDMQSSQNIHYSMQKNQTKILVLFIWRNMLYYIYKNYFYIPVNFSVLCGEFILPNALSTIHSHTVALTYSITVHRNVSKKKKKKKKSRQHPDFPGGHPPEYYPSLRLLNFTERTGYGVLSLRWPSTLESVVFLL